MSSNVNQIKSQKDQKSEGQRSKRPKVYKTTYLEVHLYQRSNVQKSKCPKDQMSTRRPQVSSPRVQRPQVYLPYYVVYNLKKVLDARNVLHRSRTRREKQIL